MPRAGSKGELESLRRVTHFIAQLYRHLLSLIVGIHEVLLHAAQDDGRFGTVVRQLRQPYINTVLQRSVIDK